MRIEEIRQELSTHAQRVFLDSACVSAAPRRAVKIDIGILVSVCCTSGVGGVRLACHAFNMEDGIGRLIEPARALLRQHEEARA